MTPLRWNWSANTRGSLKPGRVSDLASPLSAAHTGRVSGSDGCFGRAQVPDCAEDYGEEGPDADVVKSRLCDISRMALLSHFPDMCNLSRREYDS